MKVKILIIIAIFFITGCNKSEKDHVSKDINTSPIQLSDLEEDHSTTITSDKLLHGTSSIGEYPLAIESIFILDNTKGTLSQQAIGVWTFTPVKNFHGQVEFTFIVSNGRSSQKELAFINVTSVNDAPFLKGNYILEPLQPSENIEFFDSTILEYVVDVDHSDLHIETATLVGDSNSLFYRSKRNSWIYNSQIGKQEQISFIVSDGELTVEVLADISFEIKNCQLEFKGKNIVLSYDDSPITDYTEIYQWHKELKIPGEIGVWIEKVQEFSGKPDHITIEHLKEMQNFGFDIVSHTTRHSALADGTLLKTSMKGDSLIRTNIDSVYSQAIGSPFYYQVINNSLSQEVSVKSIGRDAISTFTEFNEVLLAEFPPYSKFGHTDEGLLYEVEFSKHFLESYGLDVKHISYPFGMSDQRVVDYSSNVGYETGRDAVPNRNAQIVNTLYENTIENYYQIKSLDFAYLSKERISEILSSSTSEDQFIILFTHSWDSNLIKENFSDLYQIAIDNGFEFTTRTKSLQKVCE